MIRRVILYTNQWPVMRTLYRAPYRCAAALLGRAATETPGVRALFARGSYATGEWVAGRSDIDLTAVLSPGLSPGEELATAQKFQARAGALRRRFPMIGEVEVLAQDCLAAHAAHAYTGLQSARWLPLTRGAMPLNHYVPSAGRERRDRLAYALRTYRHDVPRAVHSQSRETLARLTGKIFRTLGAAAPAGVGGEPEARWAALAFGALASACEQPHAAISGEIASPTFPNFTYRLTELPPAPGDFGNADAPRIPMTPAMFTQYLALADPVEQLLLTVRNLLPPDMDLPDAVLAESVRRYAVDIYTFPFRAETLTLSAESFAGILRGWFLWTLRYLETGSRDLENGEVVRYAERHHPELDLAPETSQARFHTLRQAAGLIARACHPA